MNRPAQDVHRMRGAGLRMTTADRAAAAETRDIIRSVSKSIWRERHSKNFRFYCPFCATPRRLGLHPKLGSPTHFAQVGLTSLMFTIAAWPLFGAKGLVSFVLFWVIFEVFYRAKVRASLRCTNCGFDPMLYLVDVDRAREAIRVHWEKKLGLDSAAAQKTEEVEEVEESEEFEPIPAENEDEELTQPV